MSNSLFFYFLIGIMILWTIWNFWFDYYSWSNTGKNFGEGFGNINKMPDTTVTLIGNNPIKPKKGYILEKAKTFTQWDNYALSFTIKPITKTSGWRGIIHNSMTGGNCCHNYERWPGIWFFNNTTRMHIRWQNNRGVDPSYHLPLGQKSIVTAMVNNNNVRVIIRDQNDTIKFDQSTTLTSHDPPTQSAGNVDAQKFYMCGPWYNPANVEISGLILDSNVSNPTYKLPPPPTHLTLIGSAPVKPKRNHVLTEASRFSKWDEYAVSFTIKPLSKKSGWRGIIHNSMTGGNCCHNYERWPGIWFFNNTTRMHIRWQNNRGIDPSYHLPIGVKSIVTASVKGNKVRVVIRDESETVKFDQSTTLTGHTPPTPYIGAQKFYMCGPWYNAADVEISNLILDSNVSSPKYTSDDVYCRLTVDNVVDQVKYNGKKLNMRGGNPAVWGQAKEISFTPVDGGKLEIKGHETAGTEGCKHSGLIVECESKKHPKWNKWGTNKTEWKTGDDRAVCISTSGFNLPGAKGYGKKIWDSNNNVEKKWGAVTLVGAPGYGRGGGSGSGGTAGYTKSGDNFCVDANQKDLPQTNWSAGNASRSSCQSECDKKPECSAIEWYDGGWGGSKCKLMLGTTPSTTSKQGNRWQDAECFIKNKQLVGGPSYKKMPKNTNCPTGTDISTEGECQKAIRSLGLKYDPWWTGNHGNIPRGCTWTDAVGNNASRGSLSHWNAWTSSAGKPRSDLHPICSDPKPVAAPAAVVGAPAAPAAPVSKDICITPQQLGAGAKIKGWFSQLLGQNKCVDGKALDKAGAAASGDLFAAIGAGGEDLKKAEPHLKAAEPHLSAAFQKATPHLEAAYKKAEPELRTAFAGVNPSLAQGVAGGNTKQTAGIVVDDIKKPKDPEWDDSRLRKSGMYAMANGNLIKPGVGFCPNGCKAPQYDNEDCTNEMFNGKAYRNCPWVGDGSIENDSCGSCGAILLPKNKFGYARTRPGLFDSSTIDAAVVESKNGKNKNYVHIGRKFMSQLARIKNFKLPRMSKREYESIGEIVHKYEMEQDEELNQKKDLTDMINNILNSSNMPTDYVRRGKYSKLVKNKKQRGGFKQLSQSSLYAHEDLKKEASSDNRLGGSSTAYKRHYKPVDPRKNPRPYDSIWDIFHQ